jgi:hypothetical protein
MSHKEEFYNKVGKFNVEELKSFFEKEGYTFDEFKKEYQSWKSEEEQYKKRLDKLDKPKCDCGKLIGESQSKYRCQDCYEDYMEK